MKTTSLLLCLLFGLTTACGDAGQTSSNYGKYTRAELRPYAYAPPLIPHRVLNRKCLNCHEQGLVVDSFKAPVTPHPELFNCQRCHVYADARVKPFKRNTFVGVQEPADVERPQPAGPPFIPHRLFMRENCLVCHNDPSRDEITQTTHPERSNCTQCHVHPEANVAPFAPRAAGVAAPLQDP